MGVPCCRQLLGKYHQTIDNGNSFRRVVVFSESIRLSEALVVLAYRYSLKPGYDTTIGIYRKLITVEAQ